MLQFKKEYHLTTKACLEGLAETGRIGEVHTVEGGYIMRDPEDDRRENMFHVPHQSVIVYGITDKVLYTALGWGYAGEGARGLSQLLRHLGMPNDAAHAFATDSRYFSKKPPVTAFSCKPTFIACWRLTVPDWHATRN